MLLCEVELGRHSTWQHGGGAISSAFDSYIINGQSHATWSDAACVHPDLKGVRIPTVDSNSEIFVTRGKEYIVLNPAQIRHRYIFHIKLK
jgi:poly [ADP-ribose] polymerase